MYVCCSIVLDTTLDEGRVVLAFLVLLGFNVGFAIIAAVLIAYKVSQEIGPFPDTSSPADLMQFVSIWSRMCCYTKFCV